MSEIQILQDLEETLTKWTSSPVGRRAFLQAVPLLLASCATGGHRYREGDNSGQAVDLNPGQERRMAEEVLPSMKKQYPALQDPETQRYISNLGSRITNVNGLNGNPYNYSFQVVETEQINAFALPAGPIFITTPLLALCDTEAELAGVIGHEIGHIKARHTAERIYREERRKGKSVGFLVGGGVIGGILGFGLGRIICAPQDRSCLARTTSLGAAAGAGGAALISKFGFMAHSREDELEADRIGFKTAVQAGYSKNHVGRFYEKLLEMDQQKKSGRGITSSFSDALSTHPPSLQRVRQVNQMSTEAIGFGRGTVSSSDFDRVRMKAVNIVTS
jgi:predicted Zn-dependent protease